MHGVLFSWTISLLRCVYRLFGHSGACGACGQSIPANEMVMRAQGDVFHLKVRDRSPDTHFLLN